MASIGFLRAASFWRSSASARFWSRLSPAEALGGATLPLALTVALIGLELLVAFLQAYVFTILTCIYLNDAVHPGH